MRHILSVFAILTLFAGCGRPQPQNSSLKLDIAVPVNQINSSAVTQLIGNLTSIHGGGSGVLTLAQLLAVIPFTDTEFAEVNQYRDDMASVTCVGSICTGTNSGRAQEITLSQMNLPSIGVPHVSIADDITLKFRIGNSQVLDICSVEGFSVKKFFLWAPLQAVKVKLDQNQQAVEANLIGSPTSYTRCN